MRRIPMIYIPVLVLCLCVAGCTNAGSTQSAENAAALINDKSGFELDLLADVSGTDLSSYYAEPGFGVTAYCNRKYVDGLTEFGLSGLSPCVYYEVTAWPDYSDGGAYVTRIYCSDDSVGFLGVTLASEWDAIRSALEAAGFTPTERTDIAVENMTATKDGITVTVYRHDDGSKTLHISAEVTNKNGIIY